MDTQNDQPDRGTLPAGRARPAGAPGGAPPVGTGSARLRADTGGLRETAAGLAGLRSALPDDEGDHAVLPVDWSAADVGHPGVAAALAGFAHAWGQRLGQYGAHLTAMGDALAASATGYDDGDGLAADGLAGPTGPQRRTRGPEQPG